MSGTITNFVIGTIIGLVVLNLFLFGMGSRYVDSEKIPNFINEPLTTNELEDYDTTEGLSFLKSMSFGYFINVDTIEEKGVRMVLRLLLTLIFQLIPILIITFAILDYIRGI